MKRRFKKAFTMLLIGLLCLPIAFTPQISYAVGDGDEAYYQDMIPSITINGTIVAPNQHSTTYVDFAYSVCSDVNVVRLEIDSPYRITKAIAIPINNDEATSENYHIDENWQIYEGSNVCNILISGRINNKNVSNWYQMTIERELTDSSVYIPAVIIKSGDIELTNYSSNNGRFNYIVDQNVNTIDYNIESDHTVEFINRENATEGAEGSVTLNEGENHYTIKIVDGNIEKQYDLYIYRKYPDNYYSFEDIDAYTGDVIDFDRNVKSYTVPIQISKNNFENLKDSDVLPIYMERDNLYKLDWPDIVPTGKQEVTRCSGYTWNGYGRVIGFVSTKSLSEGDNIIKVNMNAAVYGETVFSETYEINLKLELTDDTNSGSGGLSGGGGGGGTTEPTNPSVNVSGGAVVVSISETQLANLFAMLENNTDQVKLAIINVPKTEGLTKYGIELPYSAFTASNSSGVRLQTDIGSLTLMDTMLQNLINTADLNNVKFNIGYVDKTTLDENAQSTIGNHPIVSLNMELDGITTDWNNPNSPVIVSVPYTPTTEELANPELITVYYIDGEGNLNAIPNATYDAENKCMVFTTTHFSDYALSYVDKTFNDITDQNVNNAVKVLAAKGVVNGKTATEFKPNDTVTRAEFITMLSRAFEFNEPMPLMNNFTDVDSNKYYYKPVMMSKEIGIIQGVSDTKFNPNGTLNKEQVGIIVENLVKSGKLKTDVDVNGLMSKIDNANRGECAELIYGLMK